MIDDIVDFISEGLGSLWDFVTGIFDNMGEFSVGGMVFGLLAFGTIYIARDYMLNPFLQYMGTAEAIFWGAATYLSTFVVGYLVGKRMFEE